MTESDTLKSKFADESKTQLARFLIALIFALAAAVPLAAQAENAASPDEKTIIVNDAPEIEVYAFGKDVIVKKAAKGVLVLGGDVIIEGRVTGDVAVIGGEITQLADAYIGGDVIIFGGVYRPEIANPLRAPGKETVMIAMFEDEIKDLTKNPLALFSPTLSWSFFAQRLLSALFWFVISMALTTIAPGAVSRSVARFRLSGLKIVGIGVAGFLLTTGVVIGSLSVLPNYVSALVLPMLLILLMLSYVFGRVALQVSVGKMLQQRFLPDDKRSESLAILLGVLVWTTFLSIPYLWTIALFMLLSASVGIILTARSDAGWQKAANR